MPASIQLKGVGSQQVSAALKGADSPHLLQPKKGLVLQSRRNPLSHHQEGHLSTPSSKAGACVLMVGAGCSDPCEKGKSGFLQVRQDQWKTTQTDFLPGPLWSPVPSFHLSILVVANWIHLSRWCSSNYPGSKFPWRVTSEELLTPVKHIRSITFPLVTPGLV